MIKQLTFGTDAEFFLRAMTGQLIPVTGFVGGTKEEPKPIPGLPQGFAMQEDNSALEFNVPPTGSVKQMIEYVNQALAALTKLLPKAVLIDFDSASAEVPKEYLKHIQELSVFGCDPDYNAWKMHMNDKPVPKTAGFRSVAGHVHLGWAEPTDEDRLEIIRLADVFVTLPFLAKENKSEIERRSLYGKAGAFRFKEYGVEHRVPSNQWLIGEARIRTTLHQYLKAVGALNCGILIPEDHYDRIESIINEHDVEQAKTYTSEFSARLTDDWNKEVWALEDEHMKEFV